MLEITATAILRTHSGMTKSIWDWHRKDRKTCCRHESQTVPSFHALLKLPEETFPLSFKLNFMPKEKKKKITQSIDSSFYFKWSLFSGNIAYWSRYSLEELSVPIFYSPEYTQQVNLHLYAISTPKSLKTNINHITYREGGLHRIIFLFNSYIESWNPQCWKGPLKVI